MISTRLGVKVYNAVLSAIGAEAGWKPYRTGTFSNVLLPEAYFTPIDKSSRYAQTLYKSARKQGGLCIIPRSAL